MKKLLPLLLVIGAVLVSGCGSIPQITTEEDKIGTNGLIITSFSSDASSIPAGDSIELLLEVKNVGGAEATDAIVDLSGVYFGTGTLDWNCGGDEKTSGVKLTTPLLPPEQGIPGDVDSNSWYCKSPSDIKSDTPYTFDVRMTYGYSTDVTGKLNFVDDDYWGSLSQDEKQKLAGGVSFLSQSDGPLSIKLYSGSRTRPFVIYPGETTEEHTLRIIIQNVGSGKPVDHEVTIESLDLGGELSLVKKEDCVKTVTLSRGKSASVSCKVRHSNPQKILNRQDITVKLHLTYKWFVDSSTDVTVEKPLT